MITFAIINRPHTRDTAPRPLRHGFTLTELLVVLGLISVLLSLLLPVVAKVRVAANAARCASNLHQMGVGWSMYVAENHGRVPEYIWYTPMTPNVAWHGYWLGILDHYGINRDALLCPSAREPTGMADAHGYGDALHNWTGRYASNGSVVRFNDTTYRDGSYGYNRYLTVGGFARAASNINVLQDNHRMPLFMDCVYADTIPENGSQAAPPRAPPDLTGSHVTPGSPEHWKFLISRHGRGINVCMVDNSVLWVPLEDTYTLCWKSEWVKFSLALPPG